MRLLPTTMSRTFPSAALALPILLLSLGCCCVAGQQQEEEEVHYSLIANETADWAEASARCAMYGGSLAVVQNASQWTSAMQELISDVSWIGLRYNRSSASWVWYDGSPLTFTDVQPKPLSPYWQGLADGGLDICATAFGLNVPWDPENCSKSLHYLCQQLPKPPTEAPPPSGNGNGGSGGYYWVKNPNYKSTDAQTIMEGLLKGFGFCLGLILASCLLIQLPCCRNWAGKKNILFLRRHPSEKAQEAKP